MHWPPCSSAGWRPPIAAGVGRDCDVEGRLRDRDGTLAEHLCVAGPLARAALAEVTGVPEASAHTRRIAERLAADLAPAPAGTVVPVQPGEPDS